MDERALCAFSGDDVHPMRTTFERGGAAREREMGTGPFASVALEAVFGEYRFDVVREIHDRARRRWQLAFLNAPRCGIKEHRRGTAQSGL